MEENNEANNQNNNSIELNKIIRKRKMYNFFTIITIISSVLLLILLYYIYNLDNDGVIVDPVIETVTSFNSIFEQFTGDRIRGTQVKSLIALVREHNLTYSAETEFIISINGKTLPSELNEMRVNIKNGNTYMVKIIGYKSNGFISEISINNNSEGGI